MEDSEKVDLYKQHKAEYKATSKLLLVETTEAQYLAIEGHGAPGGAVFEGCIGALYSMAFTIKMTRKFEGLGDYVVCKLEALWGTEDGAGDFVNVPQEDWHWTLMIRTPDCVTQADLDKAVNALLDKGKCESVKDVQLITMNEGQCIQMLHVGPYDQVGQTIEKMKAFIGENGQMFNGKYHEIYLSDPRRVAPEKLKTIIRRPVK